MKPTPDERLTDSITDSTAVVLAGGFSNRFGAADKALADLNGRPLINRLETPTRTSH